MLNKVHADIYTYKYALYLAPQLAPVLELNLLLDVGVWYNNFSIEQMFVQVGCVEIAG